MLKHPWQNLESFLEQAGEDDFSEIAAIAEVAHMSGQFRLD